MPLAPTMGVSSMRIAVMQGVAAVFAYVLLALVVGVGIYLVLAMLKPERF